MVLIAALSAVGLASCGGGERQDANEPEGTFKVQVVKADFPDQQALAENTNLVLTVANAGGETIPDLAVTIFTSSNAQTSDTSGEPTTTGPSDAAQDEGDTATTDSTASPGGLPEAQGSFSVRSSQPGLAIPYRPVWILEEGFPKLAGQTGAGGHEAAQTNTFAFGSLDPHQSKQMIWNVTPVVAGDYTVHYRIAAGLQGKAKAETSAGDIPEGEFVVNISSAPPQTRVDDSGKVVPITPGDIVGQAGSQEQKSEVNGK